MFRLVFTRFCFAHARRKLAVPVILIPGKTRWADEATLPDPSGFGDR